MKNSSDDRTSARDGDSASQRRCRAKEIVADVLERRGRGQAVTDSEVLAAHPELAAELRPELELAAQIRQALLSARRTHPSLKPLRLLTDSEIEAPVEPSSGSSSNTGDDGEIHPRIPGYFLIEEINRGGQAIVYRAVQESTGRTVAVKVIMGGPFVSSRHRARFEREAQILAALDHPNVVSILERGRTPDGSFYFVMQYVDGLALDDYWKQQIGRDIQGTRQVAQLFIKIANAVESAHVRGLVHRDLKPSNIRVDPRGEPHVLDFGLARPTGDDDALPMQTLTMPGQIVGSLPWASPEQAAGFSSDVDARSDVYSIGVILYQSLTGKFPYSSEGPIDQILRRIRTAEAPPPSKQNGVRTGVDQRLDAIVLKALSKSPRGRYESAGKLALDLEAWLAGSVTLARRRWLTRRRVLRLATVLVITCGTAWAVAWKVGQAIPPTVAKLPSMVAPTEIRLVRVPNGGIWSESGVTEEGRKHSEGRRYLSIKNPFYISISLVTQWQYEQIMIQNASDARWHGDDFPVQNVSWDDATEFCKRLSEKEHIHHFRLPTEIEWEYACEAGSAEPFNGTSPEKMGWYAENSGSAIHPAMEKWPNSWGLFDMHGNVGEWCEDALADINPQLEERIIKGGDATMPQLQCSSISRSSARQSARLPYVGFRVACNP